MMMKYVLPSLVFLTACGNGTLTAKSNTPPGTSDGTGSEIATSVLSGALSGGGSSNIASDFPATGQKRKLFPNWISEAQAASWSCTSAGFATNYSGPGTYNYTPLSCHVTYANGEIVGATWTGGDWNFVYGSSCGPSTGNKAGFIPDNQTSGCAITRTSPVGGLTRSITGVNGYQYSILHDTTGTNTGYNSAVVPTSNAGVTLTCTTTGCASRSLVISGSHLKGTLSPPVGKATTFWDHTVSTQTPGLSIIGTGGSKIANGSIIVQHNLAKFTTTSTFSGVAYGDPNCCFPTAGLVTTVFSGSANDTKSETLAFSGSCGETILTQPNGSTSKITLAHCL